MIRNIHVIIVRSTPKNSAIKRASVEKYYGDSDIKIMVLLVVSFLIKLIRLQLSSAFDFSLKQHSILKF